MNRLCMTLLMTLSLLSNANCSVYDLNNETTLSTNELIVGSDFFSFASIYFGSGNEKEVDSLAMAIDIQYSLSVIGIKDGAKWGVPCAANELESVNSCVLQDSSMESQTYRGSTFNVHKSNVYVKFDATSKFDWGKHFSCISNIIYTAYMWSGLHS